MGLFILGLIVGLVSPNLTTHKTEVTCEKMIHTSDKVITIKKTISDSADKALNMGCE